MSRTDTETASPWTISKERKLSMPLALLISLLGIVAVGAIAWSSTKDQVIRNTTDINELKKDAQTTREILIRIDENVKDLRRSQRKGDSP